MLTVVTALVSTSYERGVAAPPQLPEYQGVTEVLMLTPTVKGWDISGVIPAEAVAC